MPDRKLRVLFFQGFILLFIFAGTACADGRMVIKPIIDTGMSYQSNYYSSQDNEVSVTTYYIKPGVKFGYTTAKSNLLLNYVLKANRYEGDGTQPAGELSIDEQDYIGHDMQLTADTRLTDRLTLGLKDDYVLTRDPDRLDTYSNEITKHKYSKNSLTPNLKYQFGDKFEIGAGYTFTSIDYSSDADEDSSENRGLLNLHYNMNSLNSLDLQYQYWAKNYNKITPDYTSKQIMLSFTRALKYYTLAAGGGYHTRSFDSSLQSDLDGLIWSVSISGDRPKMLFSISQNYNDTSINNDYYVATRFFASIGHIFLKKLDASLQGYYQNSDYHGDPNNRKDDSWAVSFRLDYLRNEILSIGIESGFETRNSSVFGNDYDNMYALLRIQLNFNLGSK